LADTNERYFFAVGQKSFESGANHFSTVMPIANEKGEIFVHRRSDFLHRGPTWWGNIHGELRHASPGCLIVSEIDDANKPDGSSKTGRHSTTPNGPTLRLNANAGQRKLDIPGKATSSMKPEPDTPEYRCKIVRKGGTSSPRPVGIAQTVKEYPIGRHK